MVKENRIWSDSRKWVMGIVSALIVAVIVALANRPSPIPVTLEPDELKIYNEWVIQVAIADGRDRAKEFRDAFSSYYKNSGDGVWGNDIRLVRYPREVGKWLVVIDTFPGRSDANSVDAELKRLVEVSNTSRDLSNTLGTFFINATVIDWNLDDFSKIYGRPSNWPKPEGFTKR